MDKNKKQGDNFFKFGSLFCTISFILQIIVILILSTSCEVMLGSYYDNDNKRCLIKNSHYITDLCNNDCANIDNIITDNTDNNSIENKNDSNYLQMFKVRFFETLKNYDSKYILITESYEFLDEIFNELIIYKTIPITQYIRENSTIGNDIYNDSFVYENNNSYAIIQFNKHEILKIYNEYYEENKIYDCCYEYYYYFRIYFDVYNNLRIPNMIIDSDVDVYLTGDLIGQVFYDLTIKEEKYDLMENMTIDNLIDSIVFDYNHNMYISEYLWTATSEDEKTMFDYYLSRGK